MLTVTNRETGKVVHSAPGTPSPPGRRTSATCLQSARFQIRLRPRRPRRRRRRLPRRRLARLRRILLAAPRASAFPRAHRTSRESGRARPAMTPSTMGTARSTSAQPSDPRVASGRRDGIEGPELRSHSPLSPGPGPSAGSGKPNVRCSPVDTRGPALRGPTQVMAGGWRRRALRYGGCIVSLAIGSGSHAVPHPAQENT
jgi:hypothetical protein